MFRNGLYFCAETTTRAILPPGGVDSDRRSENGDWSNTIRNESAETALKSVYPLPEPLYINRGFDHSRPVPSQLTMA